MPREVEKRKVAGPRIAVRPGDCLVQFVLSRRDQHGDVEAADLRIPQDSGQLADIDVFGTGVRLARILPPRDGQQRSPSHQPVC
ncbi:hypothetical protein Ate02nite_46750 [Paractinoplanes tereljensis]|uniref:Uncharacterized protein n=1 Tax=Paractinoplanes tereljensis TaxID=571912 RepID=A0A919NPM5_9ACTN|nr:hypothetical protein Ate02nite_46750 [Actinoplanes tereljensis]